MSIDKKLFGEGFFGTSLAPKRTIMAGKFTVPPFSILDARSGDWIARKKAWLALGLKGQEGRAPNERDTHNRAYRKTLDGFGAGLRKQYNRKKLSVDAEEEWDEEKTGTSVFDPVLCEVCYKWFCPPGGHILDPFAGGSTRGIVADVLGFDYTGIEIRPEQVAANRQQAEEIDAGPTWLEGDSSDMVAILPRKMKYDMVFSCPPYYDLELYGSEENTAFVHSTYEEFIDWYTDIFIQAVARLKKNRFAVIVVGEIRDKAGAYRGFVPDTIEALTCAGATYYNELILVTRAGSLPLRAGRYFNCSRKVGKSHQNVLVFWNGDLANIKKVFPNEEN